MSEVAAAPVTVVPASPTVVSSGDSPLLFDDIVASISPAEKAIRASKAEKSEAKGKTNPEDKSVDKATKEVTTTDDTVKAKSEDKKEGKKEAKDELEKQAAKEAEVQRKILKAKLGDKELDLDEEAEITVKINGQDVPVKINELMSNYSGKTNWNKQFQDLSFQKKELSSVKAELQKANETYKSIFEEQNPQIRMFKMAEQAGVDPIQFRQKFLDDNLKLLEKYSTMDEHERKADAIAFENSVLKYRMDTRSKMEAESQAKAQHEAEVSQLLTSHKLTSEDYETQEQQLKQIYQQAKLDPSQITPKMIVETRIKDKLWITAEPLLEQAGKKLTAQQMTEFVDTAFANGLDESDLAEVIDQSFGKGRAKQVVEEKKAQAEEFKTGKKPSYQAPKQEANDVWSFEQI